MSTQKQKIVNITDEIETYEEFDEISDDTDEDICHDEQREEHMKTENIVRAHVRKIIKETLGRKKYDIPDDPDAASFDELANELGYASPSGAKAAVDKTVEKFKWLFQYAESNSAEFNNMIITALSDYTDELESSGAIDRKESQFFRDNPVHVVELDSFRVFLKRYVKKARKGSPDSNPDYRSEIPAHPAGQYS